MSRRDFCANVFLFQLTITPEGVGENKGDDKKDKKDKKKKKAPSLLQLVARIRYDSSVTSPFVLLLVAVHGLAVYAQQLFSFQAQADAQRNKKNASYSCGFHLHVLFVCTH